MVLVVEQILVQLKDRCRQGHLILDSIVADTFTPGDGYKYHIFTASSTPGFAVSVVGPGEVEYVMSVDNFQYGGGGRRTGGGGGAWRIGFRSGSSTGLTFNWW